MSLAIPPARFALTTLIAARLSPAPAEVRHICPPQPLSYTLPSAIVRAAAEVAAAALFAVVALLRATSSFARLERKSSANQPSGSDPLTLPFTQPPVRVVLGVVRVVLGVVRVVLGVVRVVRGVARVVLGVVRGVRGLFALSGAFFELFWELFWVLFWHLFAVF